LFFIKIVPLKSKSKPFETYDKISQYPKKVSPKAFTDLHMHNLRLLGSQSATITEARSAI